MRFEASGKVAQVVEVPGRAPCRMVVIDDGEDALAARFYGRAADEASGVMAGQYVRISGRIKSREWNGKFFTDFDAQKLVITTKDVAQPDGPPPPDDEDIPF